MATDLSYSPIKLASSHGLGAFSLHLEEDGGLVSSASLELGYGRRNIESVSQQIPFSQALNYADRVDYLAAPAYTYALASCFEEILGMEVPERAQYIRMVLLEINRITSHLHFYARISKAVGQASLMNHCLRERERFSDIMEMYCGSRMGFGSVCLGGVISDASDGWFFRIEKAVSFLREFLPDLKASLLSHPFFAERARGLGELSAEEARRWNIKGPNARASGVSEQDVRVSRPIGAYRFVSAVPNRYEGENGDTLDRTIYRMHEMMQSADLIQKCFQGMPAGNHRIRVGIDVIPPAGKAFREVEGPRGAIAVMAESKGERFPASVKFFSPSSMVVQVLPGLLEGLQLEDLFLMIHSFDLSFSEVDK